MWWFTGEFGPDIYGAQRMNTNDFGEPMSFNLLNTHTIYYTPWSCGFNWYFPKKVGWKWGKTCFVRTQRNHIGDPLTFHIVPSVNILIGQIPWFIQRTCKVLTFQSASLLRVKSFFFIKCQLAYVLNDDDILNLQNTSMFTFPIKALARQLTFLIQCTTLPKNRCTEALAGSFDKISCQSANAAELFRSLAPSTERSQERCSFVLTASLPWEQNPQLH